MNADEGLETLLWLETMLPPESWRKVLYIGWHPKTFGEWDGDWYLHHIRGRTKGAKPSHTIIEACPAYADLLRANPVAARYAIRVLTGDVTKFAAGTKERFDLVIWWHGPEHVEQDQLAPTLAALESICTGAVVIGCPLGDTPYEDPEGNDKHRCAITDALLNDLGYQTILIERTWKQQDPSISAVKLCPTVKQPVPAKPLAVAVG